MAFSFGNKKKAAAHAWVTAANKKIEFQTALLHMKPKGEIRDYNSLKASFLEMYNLEDNLLISEIVLERYSVIKDCKKLLRKLYAEKVAYKNTEEFDLKLLDFETECNLVEEFLVDVVVYSNFKLKTSETGLILNYHEACNIWDNFFTKWKIPYNVRIKKYFEPGKYYSINDKLFCDRVELGEWYVKYLKVANDCKYMSKKDFRINTSACVFYRIMHSMTKIIGNSAIFLPEKQ